MTTYIYGGHHLLAEITTRTATSAKHPIDETYTWGTYIDELLSYTDHSDSINPDTYYVTTDRQFSVRTVVDSDGNIVEERNYSPMGVDLEGNAETSDLTYGFTGRRYDVESDLYYFRARYYSTELGQFISRDPLEYVDGMNMYSGYFARVFAMDSQGTFCEYCKITLFVATPHLSAISKDGLNLAIDRGHVWLELEEDGAVTDVLSVGPYGQINQQNFHRILDGSWRGITNFPTSSYKRVLSKSWDLDQQQCVDAREMIERLHKNPKNYTQFYTCTTASLRVLNKLELKRVPRGRGKVHISPNKYYTTWSGVRENPHDLSKELGYGSTGSW
ncbi:RHS repeat-associated core domain-containing protein [Lentisphaera profundi]|uniref:RHS repeat-associated core domain-containing protein n=1 Tax=Lentisphaera profundi TaxID=1658616 RepID=A0ABY7VSU0_9BACT|nr:RHS repeat-associated core domain-containing protein [Lentisphaera profundi]WDE95906.1 RHS repeat-associated core domain-containing protein [Lentisphaera profundi]